MLLKQKRRVDKDSPTSQNQGTDHKFEIEDALEQAHVGVWVYAPSLKTYHDVY